MIWEILLDIFWYKLPRARLVLKIDLALESSDGVSVAIRIIECLSYTSSYLFETESCGMKSIFVLNKYPVLKTSNQMLYLLLYSKTTSGCCFVKDVLYVLYRLPCLRFYVIICFYWIRSHFLFANCVSVKSFWIPSARLAHGFLEEATKTGKKSPTCQTKQTMLTFCRRTVNNDRKKANESVEKFSGNCFFVSHIWNRKAHSNETHRMMKNR